MKNIYLMTALIFSFFSSQVFAEVVVIVNPSVSAEVSSEDIKKIFLGKSSKLADGTKITPYYLAGGDAAREAFDNNALGKSSSQLKAYWSKLVFTGKGTPPKELDSSAQAVATVAGDASAIAYVDSAAVNDSVKVVARF